MTGQGSLSHAQRLTLRKIRRSQTSQTKSSMVQTESSMDTDSRSFSIGHKIHGRQMRTGWTTSNPSSMDDYDASQSNILFETWISSCAKFDYKQQNCDLIL